jgi:hypothetical protein
MPRRTSFECLFGPEPYDTELAAGFRATFPIERFTGDIGQFLGLVKSMAQKVPVFHGYAGFAFNTPLDIEQEETAKPLLFGPGMRFQGLDIDDTISMRWCRKSIKGVSWLTLVASELLEKVGGIAAVRAQVSDAIVLHDMPWGTLIQAGRGPGAGDVNAGDRLPFYREVNKVLRPIRVVDLPSIGHLGREKTDIWLRRLDE